MALKSLFSEEYCNSISQHLAECFCILCHNAAVCVLLLRKGFAAGQGLAVAGRIVRNERFLSRSEKFVTLYVSEGALPVLHDSEVHTLVGGFSRYFFVRLPTTLNARIKGQGRPSSDEISDISKRIYIEFSRRYPTIAGTEIQNGLFEEFFAVVRGIKQSRFWGQSRYEGTAFRYDCGWLFDRLENSSGSLAAVSGADTQQPIAAAIDDHLFHDGDVLFALTMRDCFSIFLNALEDEYREALLFHPIGADKAFSSFPTNSSHP